MIIFPFFRKLCNTIYFFRKFPYLSQLFNKEEKRKKEKLSRLAAGGRLLTPRRLAVACEKQTAVLELGEWTTRFKFVCFVVLQMEFVCNLLQTRAWIWVCLWVWLCQSWFYFCILCNVGDQYALLGSKWFLGIYYHYYLLD